jgi:hypothetical protein
MKFNDVHNLQEQAPKPLSTAIQHDLTLQINLIDSLHRYNNVGVYVMKNGKKGFFKEIATYINDGLKPCSWAIKIYYLDNWNIQFGINPNVNFETTNLFLDEVLQIFKQKYSDLTIDGNKKVVLISAIKDKEQAEEIVNYLIKTFQDIELEFLHNKLYKEYKLPSLKKSFKIVGFFKEQKTVDTKSSEKFKIIIQKFESIQMSKTDREIVNNIKSKLSSLSEDDKIILNNLMKDYFSEHERVSIAMKYLKNN